MSAMDKLREIFQREQERTNEAIPSIANSEAPELAAYRMGLGVRRPTQRLLLSQIFGTPDSPEETAMQQFFRIRRERV